MNPTEEQIKELWEWCGFLPYYWSEPRPHWYPDKTLHEELPPIDLNNLFKYAVPKACNYSNEDNMLEIKGQGKDTNPDPDDDGEWWEVEIGGCAGKYKSENKNLALALFWAIWGVTHND